MLIAGTGTGMEIDDVFEDEELEAEADIVSTLFPERDRYASSGFAVTGVGKGTPPTVSISVSVSPSSTPVEPSTDPIRATHARSSSTSLSLSRPQRVPV